MNTTLSRAEAAIYQDFGARLQPREWIAVLTESRRVQPPGVAALLPARQQIVGVWYSDNSAPPALLDASLKSIVEARRQTWRHEVTLLACCWDKPAGMPPEFQFHRYSGERKRSHGTILAQLQETLNCVPMSNVVCFLEHDVIYPEWYFQAVGDAFDHPTAPVVSNLDYIGLSAQGWQPVRERHEPLHQLSMRWEFALKNLERAVEQAKQGSAILEPQGDRSNWVRIPATPGLGLAPAVHVNHTAGRFTSHGEVVYGAAAATRHPHWGDHKNYWPGDTAPIATVASCGMCNQQPVQHASIEAWYDAARTQPSDFHEHVATLKELADPCEVVTEIAMWGKPSLVAFVRIEGPGSPFPQPHRQRRMARAPEARRRPPANPHASPLAGS